MTQTPPSHETIEHATGLWRDGWKQSDKLTMSLGWRGEYLVAVTEVLRMLQQFKTVPELVNAYFASPPAIDAVVEHVIRPPGGHILHFGIVEDAAYWLRLQQVQTTANALQEE